MLQQRCKAKLKSLMLLTKLQLYLLPKTGQWSNPGLSSKLYSSRLQAQWSKMDQMRRLLELRLQLRRPPPTCKLNQCPCQIPWKDKTLTLEVLMDPREVSLVKNCRPVSRTLYSILKVRKRVEQHRRWPKCFANSKTRRTAVFHQLVTIRESLQQEANLPELTQLSPQG